MLDEPLLTRAEQAVALLSSLPPRSRVTVLADADTDGIAGAVVLARALSMAGIRYRVRLTRRRDPSFYDALFAEKHDLLITADLGATDVSRFETSRIPTIILDHHVPEKDGTGPTLVHINSHLVGEDGSKTASGAATAQVFAHTLLAAHGADGSHLLPYALLGAHGDRYHGANAGQGLHDRIRTRAQEPNAGITWTRGPHVADGPLRDCLAESIDPFLARTAVAPKTADDILDHLGLDAHKPLAAIPADQRRRFTSWLTMELLEQGADPGNVARLVEPVPAFPIHENESPTLVPHIGTLVDAACRAGNPSVALAGLMGNANDLDPVHPLVMRYEDTIRNALIDAARHETLPEIGPGRHLSIHEGAFAGPVADRLMAWLHHGKQPVIVTGTYGNESWPATKVSLRARAPNQGKAGRWRLDEAAGNAARAVGGVGGGHALAAGATVPRDQTDAFLERLGKALAKQTGGGNA